MKKTMLFFSTLLCAVEMQAQTIFGIKGGVNYSTLATDVNAEFDGKVGFYLGGTVSFPVVKNLGIQPELLFSNKGYKYRELGGENKTSFNYLSIPVMFRYVSTSGFIGETGPQISFLLSAKVKSEGSPSGPEDIKDAFKSTAFAWCFGAGYIFKNGLGVEMRYNLDIGSIAKNSNLNARFTTLSAGVSWRFSGKMVEK